MQQPVPVPAQVATVRYEAHMIYQYCIITLAHVNRT
jgi:hypothetical protein